MSKEQFVEQYIVQFMATHAALNYDKACFRGEHETLTCAGMFEEAQTLAEQAWVRFHAVQLEHYKEQNCGVSPQL